MQLTTAMRKSGSYLRSELKKDSVLYHSFHYKQLHIVFPTKSGSPLQVNDRLAEDMLHSGLITESVYLAYMQALHDAFPDDASLAQYDDLSVEALYQYIHQIRIRTMGFAALEAANMQRARKNTNWDLSGSIDQTACKQQLLEEADQVIVALYDTALLPQLKCDLAHIGHKVVYLLTDRHPGNDMPNRALLCNLLECAADIHCIETDMGSLAVDVPQGNTILLAYGEDALLHCRALALDSIVTAAPTGYYAQALVNRIGAEKPCVVYIPKGLDITQHVPLHDRTKLSYWQLYLLWKDHGMQIYSLSVAQLYARYAQYFFNIYASDAASAETRQDFPIQIVPGIHIEKAREQAISTYLGSLSNVSYHSTVVDHILVNSVKLLRGKCARVISCSESLRETTRDLPNGIVSNFLFFLTDKLAFLYNTLRSDRPLEQADAALGHLDYMLDRSRGIETFPLFSKYCIGKQNDGSFLLFPYRLGGGQVQINDLRLQWTADQVDSASAHPVQVFTPYSSLGDEGAQRQTYCKAVGHGRLNLIIMQDRITCIRKGDVLLPSVGVVLSLEDDHPLIDHLTPLHDDYYSTEGLTLRVHLDPPAGIEPAQWAQVAWAYGGGMSLICNGVGIFDQNDGIDAMRKEGWLCPLSMQTQESALHAMEKHPRTALGLTADGALVVLVYSGRTYRSVGADYKDMVRIARQLYPNIVHLMNVDGGGSAVLGLVTKGSFLELSFPSPSSGNVTGMARPVRTALYIPLDK